MLKNTTPTQVKPKRILCLFDFAATTGYATVSKNLVNELLGAFGRNIWIDIIAINYFGEDFQYAPNVTVTSAVLLDQMIREENLKNGIEGDQKPDDFGRLGFLKMLQHDPTGYDGIYIIQDITVIQPIIQMLRTIKKRRHDLNLKQFKSIFYFPIDCPILPGHAAEIEFFDRIVTYTEYGRQVILKLRPELRSKVKVIPHGNNPKDFYPLPVEERNSFREKYFRPANNGKFIVTCVNRNQPRKDIPATILGFVDYKKNYNPKSMLYLHMDPKDPMGNDIRAIMMQIPEMEEFEDFMLLRDDKAQHGSSVDEMNHIYNASDVFLTTAKGGGWELTVTEAMAAGVPVIAPMHTSFAEIGANGRILFMEDFEYDVHTIDNIIRPRVYADEVSEKLNQVYTELNSSDPALALRVESSKKWVNALAWKYVCQSWVNMFKEVYGVVESKQLL